MWWWDLARGLIVAGYIAVVGYWLLWAFWCLWCLWGHSRATTATTTRAELERYKAEAERRYKAKTNASPDR